MAVVITPADVLEPVRPNPNDSVAAPTAKITSSAVPTASAANFRTDMSHPLLTHRPPVETLSGGAPPVHRVVRGSARGGALDHPKEVTYPPRSKVSAAACNSGRNGTPWRARVAAQPPRDAGSSNRRLVAVGGGASTPSAGGGFGVPTGTTTSAVPTARSPSGSDGEFTSCPPATSLVEPPPSRLPASTTPIDTRNSAKANGVMPTL